jgi:hypothetical protein
LTITILRKIFLPFSWQACFAIYPKIHKVRLIIYYTFLQINTMEYLQLLKSSFPEFNGLDFTLSQTHQKNDRRGEQRLGLPARQLLAAGCGTGPARAGAEL